MTNTLVRRVVLFAVQRQRHSIQWQLASSACKAVCSRDYSTGERNKNAMI